MIDNQLHRHHPGPGPQTRRVVIAGAGIAAIETLLALRAECGDRVEVRVLTPGESFVQRPASVADCFGGRPVAPVDLTAVIAAYEAVRVMDSLEAVDHEQRTALTRSGDRLPYDELVVAVGARAVPAVPGALVFRGGADVPPVQAMLQELEARRASHLVFVLPSGSSWPLPVYELALAAADWAARGHLSARFSVVTAERTPLERFGALAGDAIASQLREQGVELHCRAAEASFRAGVLRIEGPDDAKDLRADRVIALPRLRGPRLAGLPSDVDGFIPIDEHGRVSGLEGVYAAGDATVGTLKNGALAAAQADAVAAAIAQHSGTVGAPAPFSQTIRGLLIADGRPLYVRADEAAAGEASVAAAGPGAESRPSRPLWWPAAGAGARHLASFVESARRAGAPRTRAARREQAAAVELTLLLADCDARAGDHAMALHALDCAEALGGGALPSQYAAKRVSWEQALTDDARGPRAAHASPG